MRKQQGTYSNRLPDYVDDARCAAQVSRLSEEQLDTSDSGSTTSSPA